MRKNSNMPHVKVIRPARGGIYYYFDTGQKKPGGRTIYKRLPAPSDRDFGSTYAALLAHRTRRENVTPMLMLGGLIEIYRKSAEFRKLRLSSQVRYETYLEQLRSEFQSAPANGLERRDMLFLVDNMADRPGAANLLLKVTSALYAWGRKREHVTIKPCAEIDMFELGEHEPWPEHVVEAALQADDARVRLATHLLYFTAQRIGDVCAMRWTDIRDGRFEIVQRKGTKPMSIAIHARLAALLDQTPRAGLTILSADARPLKEATLRGNLQAFAKDGFGLDVVPHGLRKNAVNALLEIGCSVAETAAISGQSLQMVEHYAKRRNTQRLGDAAILKWEGAKP